jgi:hypothetical protein
MEARRPERGTTSRSSGSRLWARSVARPEDLNRRGACPSPSTTYSIFITSPSGLEDIRKAFREEVHEFNQRTGRRRKIVFDPVGWEDTLGSYRRPQSLINDELERCDRFLLVLWNRWGSPPDTEGKFSSSRADPGSRSAFELSLICTGSPLLDFPRRPFPDAGVDLARLWIRRSTSATCSDAGTRSSPDRGQQNPSEKAPPRRGRAVSGKLVFPGPGDCVFPENSCPRFGEELFSGNLEVPGPGESFSSEISRSPAWGRAFFRKSPPPRLGESDFACASAPKGS